MKNLLSKVWISTKFFGVVMVAGGITQNIMTYNFTKEDISKAEKNGKEYAEYYCKMTLRRSYESSRIARLVNGDDDAAREYLELNELNM